MTWTAVADSVSADIYFVNNSYVVVGYVLETWAVGADEDGAWQVVDSASTTWQ